MYRLFGMQASGSAAVEVALEQCGVAFCIINASSWEQTPAAEELERLNPLKQIPTLQLPDGSILTESAAILIHLGLEFPASAILPTKPSERAQSIRGLVYIAANCYSAIGIIDYPERWLPDADESTKASMKLGARERLYRSWEIFADQFTGQAFLAGATPGGLDFLAAVVSKWSASREHLRTARPEFLAMLERIDNHPGVAPVFARHW